MATDNLFDAFEEQRELSGQLRRIVFGDPPAHPVGLLERMEQLDKRLEDFGRKLQRIEQQQRPSVWLWVAGYAAFLLSGWFAMSAMLSTETLRAALDLPAWLATGLALLFAVTALLLFVAGFGWLVRR
jgi:hypothetical protein